MGGCHPEEPGHVPSKPHPLIIIPRSFIYFVLSLQRSPEALQVACHELRCMLSAVGTEVEEKDLPSVLLLLHQKKCFVSRRTTSYCQSHNHVH